MPVKPRSDHISLASNSGRPRIGSICLVRTFSGCSLVWLQKLYSFWQELPIPVIAAVHGFCYGSATELILGCDIRIAADNAKFSIPEVRFGLSPDMGGTTRLTHLVGMGQAKRLIMGCEEIDAEEALRIGLIEPCFQRKIIVINFILIGYQSAVLQELLAMLTKHQVQKHLG